MPNEFKASTDQLRSAAEERLADAKKRDAALHEAIEKQTIGPLQPKSAYSFALLHAAIIRRLLAANERLASPKDPGAQPIERIYPKRFEIIIDLNLEYPGGREAARQWVFDHIERRQTRGESGRRRAANSIREGPTKQPVYIRATGSARHSRTS